MGCDCKRDGLGSSHIGGMKCLIRRSGDEAKHDVEFPHSSVSVFVPSLGPLSRFPGANTSVVCGIKCKRKLIVVLEVNF